jgi:hypothetical protein
MQSIALLYHLGGHGGGDKEELGPVGRLRADGRQLEGLVQEQHVHLSDTTAVGSNKGVEVDGGAWANCAPA